MMPLVIGVDNEEDFKDFEAAKELAGKMGTLANGQPSWVVMLALAMLVAYGIRFERDDSSKVSDRECLDDHMEAVAAFLNSEVEGVH